MATKRPFRFRPVADDDMHIGTAMHPFDDHDDNLSTEGQANPTFSKTRQMSDKNAPGYLRRDSTSQTHLKPSQTPPDSGAEYHLRRHISRTVLNTIGPLCVLVFYVWIVVHYIRKPSVNDIVPRRTVNARGVFFAWLILSIFLLDWAKSGIAGLEAAALATPGLAPRNARQLMWHTDRAWGSMSGWYKVTAVAFSHFLGEKRRRRRRGEQTRWEGPAPLWFYLALSSMLFFVAIPLSGLSLDPSEALEEGNRPVTILGLNQSTFDVRVSTVLADAVFARWKQGNPTTPQGATIFYAPKRTDNASATFFEDAIQMDYQARLKDATKSFDQGITYFSGPQVAERAYGSAWGVLTNVSCAPVHPYKSLRLLNVTAINNWTSATDSSRAYGTAAGSNITGTFKAGQQQTGLTPTIFNLDRNFGVNTQYVMASDRDISGVVGSGDYINSTLLPLVGAVELVLWQAYDEQLGFVPDQVFQDMATHPFVVSSQSAFDNLTYLGFGIQCAVTSNVGAADISAVTNTFRNFETQAADRNAATLGQNNLITEFPAIAAIQTLVLSAFSSINLGYFGPPRCPGTLVTGIASSCGGWIGANAATNGVPIFVPRHKNPQDSNVDLGGNIQYPTISPERMNLAMYKLFGEVAVGLMATGPGNWTSTPNATSRLGLFGLDPTSDIVGGRVPYTVVLVLLTLWVAVTVIPQLWPPFLVGRRWASTLDGFAMFRFGAEWPAQVHELRSGEFWEADGLHEVPGMIGDMQPGGGGGGADPLGRDNGESGHDGGVGFIGLSRYKAVADRSRVYTYREPRPPHGNG